MSDPGSVDVLTELRGRVLLVTLNRPEKLNAVTSGMIDRLIGALAAADSDDAVGAIVLTGAGRGFCAGADTSGLAETTPEEIEAHARDFPRDLPVRLSKPLIAAVNGPAAGMGLSLALMADVRFASTAASATTAFARYGLVAEQGSAYLLQQIVGRANALDLLLSSRRVDSETGYRIGLFQYLVEPEVLIDEAVGYANRLTEHSAYSIAQMKEQVLADPARTWADAYADAVRRMDESLGRDEFTSLTGKAKGSAGG